MTRTRPDPADQQPLYQQLAAILRHQIRTGQIPPRRALPPKTRLAQEHEVSMRTVDSALAVLREEGLIVTERGKGIYVADRPR